MQKSLFSIFLTIVLSSFFSTPRAQVLDSTMAVVSGGFVQSVATLNNNIYLGGNFNYIGPRTGTGVPVDVVTGMAKAQFPKMDGKIYTIISDGKGGWFIGGSFKISNAPDFANLIHVNPNYSLDKSWNPKVIGIVRSLALSNRILYVGGGFFYINGQRREHIGSIDLTTGQTTDWNPVADHEVRTIIVSNNGVIVGGVFTHIGDAQRNYLAKLDLETGLATPWNAHIDQYVPVVPMQTYVNTVSLYNNTLYVGGRFESIAGQARKNIASFDINSAELTNWNPNADSEVMSITITGKTVCVGGRFNTINGKTGSSLASFNADTGIMHDSGPTVYGQVFALSIFNNILFIGGDFSKINGQERKCAGAIDITTGNLTLWSPKASGGVFAIGTSSITAYLGGDFLSINGQTRNNLASINANTGQVTDWNPNANTTVRCVTAIGNRIYAGGDFTLMNGQTRYGIAAFDANTGHLTPWNPSTQHSTITTISITDDIIYVGGWFSKMGGKDRNNIAAIDPVTGVATAWNPNSNGNIFSLAVKDDLIYAGGDFTNIGGVARNRIASIHSTTGLATAWNPDVNNNVYSISASENLIYIGGGFTMVNGQTRNYIAALDHSTGVPTSWNPNADNWIRSIIVSGDTIYVGGHFDSIGGELRSDLAAINKNTGLVTSWKPFRDYSYGDVTGLSKIGSSIYAVGNFISNSFSSYFASFGERPVLKQQNNIIKGKNFADTNKNCLKEPSEDSLANYVVVAKPGPYFAYSDEEGNYTLAVDTGTYTVTQVIPKSKHQLVQQVCPANQGGYTITFTGYNHVVQELNFANEIIACPQLSASVTSDRRRRCFRNNTNISYNNIGLAGANGVRVHIKFSEYVVPISSDIPWTIDKDSVYIFEIGILGAKQKGTIAIVDSVICGNSSIRGLTQCTKVWITSTTNCGTENPPSPDWDKSDITLKARCADNGLVKLSIYNTGIGHMADSSSFRIYLDAGPVFQHQFKLNAGDSLTLQVPANGQTVRLEADLRPFHPTKTQTNISIEACGVNSAGSVSTGFVAQLPQDDEEPEVAIECLPIIDSYDPNDKLALPAGVTENHYTPTNKALDYTIRFQNTGSDYAYKVVVVDTLSEHLDMSTFQVGAASHAYKLNISGKGRPILTFTFDNINLPDSTRDQLGSNGFIKFSIKPLASLSEKTVIENFADIFFDFNEPVRTNTVFNSIYDVPATPVNNEKVIICQTNAVVFAGANRSFCGQDTLYLQANTPAAGKGKWKLIKGTATIQNLTNPTSLVTNLGYGETVFEWKLPVNTCSFDSTSSTVAIHRKPVPGIPVITQTGTDSLFCNISAASYEWYREGIKLAETSQYIKVSENGNYTVKVSLDGCSSPLSEAFSHQKIPTGLEEYAAHIKVYPNPATSSVFVELPANWQATVTLSDAMGRAVKESILSRGEQRVELSLAGVKAGMYILHMTTKDGAIVRKLIVR